VLDATLGGGGHAAALLDRGATVVGIDRDPAAVEETRGRLTAFIASGGLTIIEGAFADVLEGGTLAGQRYEGILADLGVSSHQFDDPERGFSFREGIPLDMRQCGRKLSAASWQLTAADWLNSASEGELARVFREYGDEPKARRLARTIVHRRGNRPFALSDDLVGAIRATLGSRSGPPEFARLFQAVRIVVNDELGQLARALPAFRDRLAPGGVLVVISYHSGEDRLVKRAFQDWSRACACPPRQPMCTCGGVAAGITLTRKPIAASEAQVAQNSRARSARLRAWRRADG